MSTQPALFVSHGSPMILLEPGPARDFIAGLGERLTRPDAILVISAHYDTPEARVTGSAAPKTIHDFGGFPQALFDLDYPAPGSPALAAEITALVGAAGVPVSVDPVRGLDHGAWVPLMLGWPAADVPVVQLSISSQHTPDWHYRIGEALAPLRDLNILIMGSGSLTHNLRAVFQARLTHDASILPEAARFAGWMKERIDVGDTQAVLQAVEEAPNGRDNHPTPDHILPLFSAMGACGGASRGKRLHHSFTYGALAMDAYAFS